MKCRVCGSRAAIKLREHNLSLCEEHFLAWMRRRVASTIGKYRMFGRGSKVLVAVSGGKDSLALWDLLSGLGYSTLGLHVDLGIGEYSALSRRKTEAFAASRGLELLVIDVRALHGESVPERARRGSRSVCSLCGLTKRYYMNRVAYEKGMDVVATGHNLDDLTSALLSNLFRWDLEHLAKGLPYLPPSGERVKARAKPLALCTERQNAAYCLLSGIDYVEEECPYSEGATFLELKGVMRMAEEISPGTKLRFYTGYVQNAHLFGRPFDEEKELCDLCGMPTYVGRCAFCRTWRG